MIMYPEGQKGNCCESCKYYQMLDSAYGWCVRFPPQPNFVIRWFRTIYVGHVYPEVPFDNAPCGEMRKP